MPALRSFAPLHSPTSAALHVPLPFHARAPDRCSPRSRLLQPRSGRARRTGGADAADPGLDRQLHARRRPARHGQQDLAVGRQRAGADPLLDGRRPRLRLGGRPAPHLRRRMAGQYGARRRRPVDHPDLPALSRRAPVGPQPRLELPSGRPDVLRDGRARSGRPACASTAAPPRCSCSRRRQPTSPRCKRGSGTRSGRARC